MGFSWFYVSAYDHVTFVFKFIMHDKVCFELLQNSLEDLAVHIICKLMLYTSNSEQTIA